jgi:hypothetical protein
MESNAFLANMPAGRLPVDGISKTGHIHSIAVRMLCCAVSHTVGYMVRDSLAVSGRLALWLVWHSGRATGSYGLQ